MKARWRHVIAGLGLGACLFATTAAGVTLDDLFSAVKAGDTREVGDLIAQGMEPSSTDAHGYSLLMYAARDGRLDMVRLLLDRQAKVDARNFVGETAIMLAAYNGHLETVKTLRERGAALDGDGWTPLHYAAAQGHLAVVRYLLEQGAPVNATAPNGATPLHMAAREGATAVVQALLAAGADRAARTDRQATALDWAQAGRHTDAARLLGAR